MTLELGGKGPNIILDDADLNATIPAVLRMGFINSGQACIAGTRILAPAHRLDDVLARLKQEIETFKVGAPDDPDAMIGPMVSRKQYDRVQSYIELGTQEECKPPDGGLGRPAGLDRGWFTRPTIFTNVDNQMRIAREEIFGPVLSVIAYSDDAEAVSIANDTPTDFRPICMAPTPPGCRRLRIGSTADASLSTVHPMNRSLHSAGSSSRASAASTACSASKRSWSRRPSSPDELRLSRPRHGF